MKKTSQTTGMKASSNEKVLDVSGEAKNKEFLNNAIAYLDKIYAAEPSGQRGGRGISDQ